MRLNYPSFLNDTTDDDISSTKKMWWSYLKDYDAGLIRRANNELVSRFKKFAPTLGEYKELVEDLKSEPAFRPHKDTNLCGICRSYSFTRHHHDVCITGERSLYEVTDQQIAETKKMFAGLR